MYLGNSNKGSYIEKLIDNSAYHYWLNQVMLIEKKQVPFFFKKQIGEQIQGKIKKSTTDYYGLYQGRYFDFEVKQTEKDYFLLNQVKKHQLEHLRKVDLFNGISFLLIHFFKQDEIFIINFKQIAKLKNKLTYQECKKNHLQVKVIFPGIIDFKTLFEKLINQ